MYHVISNSHKTNSQREVQGYCGKLWEIIVFHTLQIVKEHGKKKYNWKIFCGIGITLISKCSKDKPKAILIHRDAKILNK